MSNTNTSEDHIMQQAAAMNAIDKEKEHICWVYTKELIREYDPDKLVKFLKQQRIAYLTSTEDCPEQRDSKNSQFQGIIDYLDVLEKLYTGDYNMLRGYVESWEDFPLVTKEA